MPRAAVIAVLFAALGLAGCEEEDASDAAERIRAIKTYTVVEPAGGRQRRFSGSLAASETSALSFAVAGTVTMINAAAGDEVRAGDVLAELDQAPFRLDLDAAQSELAAAQATYVEKKAAIDRQRTLYEKGWLAKAGLDQALAAFEAAEGQLNVARSKLASVERDLNQTRLVAPFDGVIASRGAEPFQELKAGEPLFQINASGSLEVDLSVPDSVVGRIAPGAPATIDVATIDGCGCEGRIAEIGVASGAANAVTVTAVLTRTADGLLAGMAAEVSLTLVGGEEDAGFLVPLTSIAPGDDAAPGYVFVFDPEARVVRKTPVAAGEGVFENLVAVRDGVAAGDVVAAAGVSFLRDGQTVKLLGE